MRNITLKVKFLLCLPSSAVEIRHAFFFAWKAQEETIHCRRSLKKERTPAQGPQNRPLSRRWKASFLNLILYVVNWSSLAKAALLNKPNGL